MVRRENTALRAQLDPSLISVIPNAIVPPNFRPDPSKADPDYSEPNSLYEISAEVELDIADRLCDMVGSHDRHGHKACLSEGH